jgi:hypothetical protein
MQKTLKKKKKKKKIAVGLPKKKKKRNKDQCLSGVCHVFFKLNRKEVKGGSEYQI